MVKLLDGKNELSQQPNEGAKACKREVLAAFKKTVLSTPKARYLSLSERSAMISCLLEFVDVVYDYIDRKDQ